MPGVGDREAVLTQQPLIDLDLALVSVMPFFVERFDLAGLTGGHGGEVVDRRERAEGESR